MRLFYFFLIFSLISVSSFAQKFSLTGFVKDKSGEVLPGAGVYVSGYKIATSTDNNGAYTLSLAPGNYNILVQLIGYKAINKNIVIASTAIKLDVILEESITQLAEVTIKPDPNRAHYIAMFRDFFIGVTPNALQCKIINPDVLIIDYDKKESLLTVKTNEFLIIENQSLGYRIKYLINLFEWDSKSKIIYYEGFPHYEDLKGSIRRKKIWNEKRLIAYNGSPQHFFKSLFNNRVTEEGFIINKLITQPNPARPSDDIISANIKRFREKQLRETGKLIISANQGDSLSYWIKKKNMPAGISILNRASVTADTLVHQVSESIKSINFTDQLYIIYTKEKEDPSFVNRIGMSINRPLDMPEYQISTETLHIAPVYFYKNGTIHNPRSIVNAGYWAWEKIADSVPVDYEPSPLL